VLAITVLRTKNPLNGSGLLAYARKP
jgi:hypothetical protein